jgi:ABC-type multidrug transport system ATPase subunit
MRRLYRNGFCSEGKEAVISIRNLGKQFGNHVALDGLSFDVRRGEAFALLGPNGSGKTTLLKSMACLVSPSSGSIEIDGVDLARSGVTARARMCYLPQQAAFGDHLRVREVVEFYARLRRVPQRRVNAVLDLLECTASADRFVSELSGGMRQRLGIAIACLPEAAVLLFDEPTASLDPEGAAGVRRLIAELKREGRTIVFASHVLADVETLADRVAILVGGRLLAVDTIDALRRQAQAPGEMRVILREAGAYYAAAARSAGAETAWFDGLTLHVVTRSERWVLILRALEKSGASIEGFSTPNATLEDIYLRYMHAENPVCHAPADNNRLPVAATSAG